MSKRLNKAIVAGRTIVPAGTVIATSGLESDKIPACAVEGQGSEIAEQILSKVSQDFPDGFTERELYEKYGDNIDNCRFSLLQVDDENVLMLKTPEDEAIELYLQYDDKVYRFDGEFHVASDSRQSFAIESEASLQTKGTLAIRGLVAHIASVLDDLPSIDRPELIRILRVASQSVSSGSSEVFKKNVGKGIV